MTNVLYDGYNLIMEGCTMPVSNREEKIPQFINEYITFLEKNIKSDSSIYQYKHEIILFLKYIQRLRSNSQQPIETVSIKDMTRTTLKTITQTLIEDYLQYMKVDRNNSDYALQRKLFALKSFFKYLTQEEHLFKTDPAAEIPNPKIEKKSAEKITCEQAQLLLDNIKGKNKERDLAILTLFIKYGISLSELVSINLEDIQGNTLKIQKNVYKKRFIPLDEEMMHILNVYIYSKRPQKDLQDAEALFLSNQKRRINKRTVENIVKNQLVHAGLQNINCTPYMLRHTAAMIMHTKKNMDLKTIQAVLGHENVFYVRKSLGDTSVENMVRRTKFV